MTEMSHIRCPMCGKDSLCASFDPESLDLDIYVRQASGLGRGKGFSFGPDKTVLGDDYYTPKVMERCIELLKAGVEKGSVYKLEIARQLKIGAPIQGTEDVVPYEDLFRILLRENQTLKMKTAELERQVSMERSGVSLFEHEQLRERYQKLEGDMKTKNKVDEVLLFLHNVLDSEIAYEGDDWVLEIYEYKPVIFSQLCKWLYALSGEERELLQRRVVTDCVEFKNIFWIMKREPTMRSVADRLIKNPGKLFYIIHDLPSPSEPRESRSED